MQDILTEILAGKEEEVRSRRKACPAGILRERIAALPENKRSMKEQLARSASGIIAEFKRRSPSKGWISRDARPEEIIPAYTQGGAAAISVLTDTSWFGGSTSDLREARLLTSLPLLRKDFTIDSYQLLEAREMEADAVLLIAAALSPSQCEELAHEAQELGLETLLEIHSETELAHVGRFIDMVGVNNRNLGTFHTDIRNSFRLSELLPKEKLLVSESGLKHPQELRELREAGYRGFLMGEHFMRGNNPEQELRTFIQQIQSI